MSTPEERAFDIINTYDDEQARFYFAKHRRGFWRRLSNWREQRIAASALAMAGNPKSVLDLPCGAGRFWELLARVPDRQLMAADYSQDMLNTALSWQPPEVTRRIQPFQTSAFEIKLPDASVDCIFCMRLLHHIDTAEARAKILSEFHRVSRDTVCLSLGRREHSGVATRSEKPRPDPSGSDPVSLRSQPDRTRVSRVRL